MYRIFTFLAVKMLKSCTFVRLGISGRKGKKSAGGCFGKKYPYPYRVMQFYFGGKLTYFADTSVCVKTFGRKTGMVPVR